MHLAKKPVFPENRWIVVRGKPVEIAVITGSRSHFGPVVHPSRLTVSVAWI
jgi:hypothetical protein